jgi:hypothetical protein
VCTKVHMSTRPSVQGHRVWFKSGQDMLPRDDAGQSLANASAHV